jgi:hypothetical protein
MFDDIDTRGSQEIKSQIDVNEPRDVNYWMERLGVSEEALRKAIADVGVSADQVAVHLGRM